MAVFLPVTSGRGIDAVLHKHRMVVWVTPVSTQDWCMVTVGADSFFTKHAKTHADLRMVYQLFATTT